MRLFSFLTALIVSGGTYSQDLDSLKRVLVSATDTARIDLLNEIGLEYMFKNNYDSADHYQYLACTESERSGYIHGLAEAYAVKAQIEKFIFNNFPVAEAYAKLAESLYDKSPDKRKIEDVYDAIWHSLAAQSKFLEARDYVFKRMEWCSQRRDDVCIADMNLILASFYIEMGQFDQAFLYVKKGFDHASKFESDDWLKLEQAFPGKIYMAIGDYEQALEYYRISFNYLQNRMIERDHINSDMWITTEFAETYALLGRFDSAFMCYGTIDTLKAGWKDLRVYLVSVGETFLMQKEYQKALFNFKRALPHNERLNDRSQVIRTELDISKSYIGLKEYNKALVYAARALKNAKETFARKSLMDAYELLYMSYDGLNDPEHANLYYRQFKEMKDSVAADQLRGRLAASNYESQLALLQQDKIIAQQGLLLQKEKFEQANLATKFLIVGIILIVLLAGVLIRNFLLRRSRLEKDLQIQKLEGKRIVSEMRQKTSELEMAAMRAQMNPHFIFNCLNAINHFILNNDPDLASEYLTKFSRLIRLVLNSSSNKLVPLSDELTTLRIYTELEQLRFRKHFDFVLYTDPDIDTERTLLPPMLMQPFVENAIWHGLMHTNNNGMLRIDINRQDKVLRCVIEDNGIGRLRSKKLKSKSSPYKKSMGMDITRNRLKLLYDSNDNRQFMQITDLYDSNGNGCGTRVQLDIPLKFADDLVDSENSSI